jgi:hypothetical protein
MPIQVSRRGFLRHSALGGCGLLLGDSATGPATAHRIRAGADTGSDRFDVP